MKLFEPVVAYEPVAPVKLSILVKLLLTLATFVAISTARDALNVVSASVAKVFTEADTALSSASVAKVSFKEELNAS